MRPFTQLVLPDLLKTEIINHAQSTLPNECCGLLAGVIVDGVGVVTERYPVRNDAASPTAYLSNPQDMIAAFRAMRNDRLELLAVYHSHPSSPPNPSPRDLEQNTYGETVVHVIVGLADTVPVVRGWWYGRWGVVPAALGT